ncbi:hypothetical protein SAMN05444349_11874 [Bacteroides faecichinchillae]|uniref:Uncharacterized protein n=1 Tax=Bacteroides faecichinchillae TaxID=871325 RepID=A0A1M5BDE6_9BACE|nr:hypothetical protein [Bacteroides faecichinchillae]SHF40445.1 hypothetical protein SAMN05444349_11874 [Bacteroides faecichinchillae]
MMKRLILYLIVFLMSGTCFTSCRSVQYVPVETVKKDSIYINKIQHDSIYRRDSVYIDRSGDTIYIYKDRYLYKYKNLTDTVYISRVDSINVPYMVEKKLTRWQSIKMELGGWAFAAIVIIIIGWLIYAKTKFI